MSVSSLGGIYGLSGSGMDIDTLVKKMMAGQQAKEDALIQKRTIAQWQKTAYNAVYDEISNFRNTVFNYKLQSTLSHNKVSSGNESVATVTASSGAPDVNHSLVVAQLADGVKLTSSASLSPAGAIVNRSSIASQFYSGTAIADIPKMSITITNASASTTITVDPMGSIYDLANQINNAGINVTADYDSALDRFFLTTNNSGSAADISFAGSNAAGLNFLSDKLKLPVSALADGPSISSSGSVQATVQIDPTKTLVSQFKNLENSTLKLSNSATGATQVININTSGSLNDLINSINAGGNATAAFDPATGKFSITPTKGGTLSIEASEQKAIDLFSQLRLPATFNPGKVTTSSSRVTIPLDVNAPLKTQFEEFGVFLDTETFNLKIDDGTGNGTFTSVVVNPTTDSLQDMLDRIKAAANVADASYDPTTGKVKLKSADGKSLNLTGSDPAGINFLANTLKLHHAGQDAVFKLDGVALSQASNTFTISGVTYTLKGVSTGAEMLSPGVMDTTKGETTNVTVTNDIDAAIKSIQDLVDSYNKILEKANGLVNEKRYSDYPPLTDAQRKEMKESEITAWEEKAKSGMLHNDDTLTSLVNTMRYAFMDPISGISGKYNSAATIGITASSNYYEGGKLYFDSAQLRTALETDPNALVKLFSTQGTANSDGTINSNTQGIAGRLYDGIKATMDQIDEIASTTANAQYDTESSYAKKISDYNKMINDAQDRFEIMQDSYYRRFNAMEVALQQLNSQSSWLSSMLTTS